MMKHLVKLWPMVYCYFGFSLQTVWNPPLVEGFFIDLVQIDKLIATNVVLQSTFRQGMELLLQDESTFMTWIWSYNLTINMRPHVQ